MSFSRDHLRAAFDKVDADKSGSIELAELAVLCGSIGLESINTDDVNILFTEIDTNHDGKISFEEFTAWYRLGRNTKLRDFLKFQLNAINKFDSHFTQRYKSCEHSGETGRHQFLDIDIRDGDVSEETATLHSFNFCSKNNVSDIERFSKACPTLSQGPEGQRAFAMLTVKANDAQKLKSVITTFFDAAKELLIEKDPSFESIWNAMKYEIGIDGDYVVLGFEGTENPFLGSFLQMGFNMEQFTMSTMPEVTLQVLSDQTLESIRGSKNLLDHTDGSRFAFNTSFDKGAKTEFLELSKQFSEGNCSNEVNYTTKFMKLMNGFRLRIKTNPASKNGTIENNQVNLAKAMGEIDIEFCKDQSKKLLEVYEKESDKQTFTYPGVLVEARRLSSKLEANKVRKALLEHSFVTDLVNGIRDFGLFEVRTVLVCNSIQMTFQDRGKGLKECFTDLCV